MTFKCVPSVQLILLSQTNLQLQSQQISYVCVYFILCRSAQGEPLLKKLIILARTAGPIERARHLCEVRVRTVRLWAYY
jgi:hypothetical protein